MRFMSDPAILDKRRGVSTVTMLQMRMYKSVTVMRTFVIEQGVSYLVV